MNDDLTPLLDDPGFTPGPLHFERLFAQLEAAARDEAPQVERVLARGGERVLTSVLERLSHATPTLRARLVNVLARLADPRAAAALRNALSDPDPRVVRRAASALGKLDDDRDNARALQDLWSRADTALKRTLAEALGKVGAPEARALLAAEASEDPELRRLVTKALLLLERRHTRETSSTIVLDVPLGSALPVVARCRAGLAELLADELRSLGPVRVTAEHLVELPFAGALGDLLVARTALDFAVRVELETVLEGALPEAVARALTSAAAKRAFAAWTRGAPRYRLSFAGGGHRRALVFRLAEAIGRAHPDLVNDPRAASWEIVVVEREARAYLALVPLAFEDPRFTYRSRDVRAASHPTIAAALARSAGARPDDVVWDPFVGSGLELIERARLGPYRTLLGSDIAPSALDSARDNLAGARVHAELRVGDATSLVVDGVTLIVTNPPMGRRLARDRTLGALLDAFVRHAARTLVPGGRLVWLSPLPELTRQTAAKAGLRGGPGKLVDMGGFDAELQVLRKV
jgi:hypothetical protein